MAQAKKKIEPDDMWKAIGNLNRKRDSNASTFIGDYVLFKFCEYEQPTRAGTPRGEKIGFSWNKYHAAMMVGITNLKLKDIAKGIGISYGLLRKWKTEPEFVDSSFFHAVGFAHEIIRRVKKYLEDKGEEIEKYFKEGNPNLLEPELESPLNDYQRLIINAPLFSNTVSYLIDKFTFTLLEDLKKNTADGSGRIEKMHLFDSLHTISYYGAKKKFPKQYPVYAKLSVHLIRDVLESKKVLSIREQR